MAHSQIHEQLADLETRWAYADMNAERLDDAAGPGGGDLLRMEAAEIRAEIRRIEVEHGIDPVTGEPAYDRYDRREGEQ